MTAAAFRATFAKVQPVTTRKVVQFIFEVPVEQSASALDSLGGFPDAAKSVWVAVARLETQPAKVEKPKRERRTSERAAMLCQSPQFIDWFRKHPIGIAGAHIEDPVEFFRLVMGIRSRSEFDTNHNARARFETLEREYQEAHR